jgi:hypothetical protein
LAIDPEETRLNDELNVSRITQKCSQRWLRTSQSPMKGRLAAGRGATRQTSGDRLGGQRAAVRISSARRC